MLKSWMTRAVLGRTSVSSALQPAEKPDTSFEATWRRPFKVRLLIMLGVVIAWAAALEARLVYLQVISHGYFVNEAKKQQQDVITSDPGRGDIRDRNGLRLAVSVESYRIIADPSVVKDPAKEAGEICDALRDCSLEERTQLAARLANKKARYAPVRASRAVSPDAALRIQELIRTRIKDKKPAVLSLFPESRRYYPMFTLASHLIGAVGFDGKGVAGVEKKFNSDIAGEPGLVRVLVDAGAEEISSFVERPATTGASLELTIDARLQHIAERELKEGIAAHHALGGSVIIMQPRTGEILAQASYPDFNPNISGAYRDEDRLNPTVQSTYEPGSTFKIVTIAAALNERVMSPQDQIDTNPGYVKIGGRKPIREAKGHNYGVLTVEDVLVKSSNVGAIRVGDRLGSERLVKWVNAFGFGQKLSPDFAGESKGQFNSGSLDESSRASIAMGYQIGVTPLQVAAAFNTIANGGVLMEPHLRRATIVNGKRTVVEPKVLRRVLTPETAATMTMLMEGVTSSRGTAKAAALSRHRVAGKTGTAAKVVNHGYSDTDYNVSFGGFVPSEAPELTILVIIDRPRGGSAYGGTVAAPIFKRIAEAALQQIGVAPSIHPAPPIISASNRTLLSTPLPAAVEQPVITRVAGRPVMPDLRGLSMREAIRVTNELGMFMTTRGSGTVVSQSPLPGELVDAGGSGSLQLQRYPSAPRGGR